MRNKIDQEWPAILIVGAFIAGLMTGRLQYTENWKPGWEMISGIGSFLAVATALWMARSDTRKRNEEEYEKMCLVAARLYAPLINAISQLRVVASTTENFQLSALRGRDEYQLWVSLLRNVNFSVMDSIENLNAVARLPNSAAFLLAEALGSISVAIQMLEYSEDIAGTRYIETVRLRTIVTVTDLAEKASRKLESVARECSKVSEKIAN